MADKFLYEEYDVLSKRIPKEIPDYLKNNINSLFELYPSSNRSICEIL